MHLNNKLLYLSNSGYGGWVSFTFHLAKLLAEKHVFKVAPSTRGGSVFYGDVVYKNCTASGLQVLKKPIITAVDKAHYKYLESIGDATIIIHDPTELSEEVLAFARRSQVITIRTTMHNMLNAMGIENTFLKHPFYKYQRVAGDNSINRSLSRVDFDKNTHIICQANLKGAGIEIHGYKNHIYYFHKLKQLGFDAYYKGAYPKDMRSISKLYADTKFLVDMSVIKKDGGGTQYTFLEAEHHNASLILHRDWCSTNNSEYTDGVNCYAVSTADELMDALKRPRLRSAALPTDQQNFKWYTTLIKNI